mmetsp:Transcript_8250/g.14908  ORF Transcript_8250/g.14908 Transcript_8250/m.14908 type:complete len:80 (-) Transcript_8250:38-277(-)
MITMKRTSQEMDLQVKIIPTRGVMRRMMTTTLKATRNLTVSKKSLPLHPIQCQCNKTCGAIYFLSIPVIAITQEAGCRM